MAAVGKGLALEGEGIERVTSMARCGSLWLALPNSFELYATALIIRGL
jgi:hypothetical protein